jgi:general secretion pathway protein K
MRKPIAHPRADERGSVTILVLWGIAIVFALLAAASYTTRTEVAIARNEVGAMRARYAAEAGTQIGLARFLAQRARGAAIFDGHQEAWRDGTIGVDIAIQDEAGRIDINQAPLELLEGLFVAVGRPKEAALLLACRVLEHRGSSAPDCPEPPDAPAVAPAVFVAPEELAALPGFGDRLYQSVADFVTVATGATSIDPMVAPRTVLMALPGATADQVDSWLSNRAMIAETEPEASGFETLGYTPYLMVTPLRDFTVSAVATTAEGARARADLQIRLTGVANRPYVVMAWRTPMPAPGRR